MIAVKWSKKEVEIRPFLTWNRKGERVVFPHNEIDVYVIVTRSNGYINRYLVITCSRNKYRIRK